MQPLLADAINFPLVAVAGLIVLVPLMAFEVFVEALVLRGVWHLSYSQLCTFAFFANLWSLVAGIPTKILNAFIYERVLPHDIPGFFASYPMAIFIGSLIYFVVTVLVESAYAFSWLKRRQLGVPPSKIWLGVFLASGATYLVLAPLHYYATKPSCPIELASDTTWTTEPKAKVLFTDGTDNYLKSINLDGSELDMLVPFTMADYLVSSNLNVCAFRGTNDNLYLYRLDQQQVHLVWQTDERFFMNQVAFSPSGDRVAYASEDSNSVEVLDASTGQRTHLPMAPEFDYNGPSVAWSTQETTFFVGGLKDGIVLAVTLRSGADPEVTALAQTNTPPLLVCYGRTGDGHWWGGADWGTTHSRDTCGELTAWAMPGLGSQLRIYREGQEERQHVLNLSVRAGLLRLARFYFRDVAFLEGCSECVFEANGHLYLLDVNTRRLGTIARGERFVLLRPSYQKTL